MIKTILKKVTKIEETLHTLTKTGTITKDAKATSSSLEAKGDDYVNGINVMLLPTKGPYKFGLMLLNMLFTKEELARSLIYKSPKSTKAGLDEARVAQLMTLISKRFKSTEYDMQDLLAKLNQKCRDAERSLEKARVKEEKCPPMKEDNNITTALTNEGDKQH